MVTDLEKQEEHTVYLRLTVFGNSDGILWCKKIPWFQVLDKKITALLPTQKAAQVWK